MAYDEKYRERVLAFIKEGNSRKKAQETFKVSRSAIEDWEKLMSETGSVKKRELEREARKYAPEKLKKILEEKPDAYLSEIAEHFEGGTVPGVQSALKKMKITRKKRQ
jgi:transposase